MARLVPLACAALVLSSCSRDATHYPSLLPRPIESRSDAEPVEAPAVATPDPTLDALIATQRRALAKAAADFTDAAATSDRLTRTAAGATPGSDGWLDAQTVLGGMEDARGSTQAVIDALEAAAIDRASTLQPPYPALDAAQKAATAQAQDQSATIARLQARLKPAG